MYDLTILYNVGGSTTRAIMERVCEKCCTFVNNLPTCNKSYAMYKDALNFGGLKDPCNETFDLLINCELLYREFRQYLSHNDSYEITRRIVNEIDVHFPLCCNPKRLIVNHFFTVRSFSAVSLSGCKNTRIMHGSSTARKCNGAGSKKGKHGSTPKKRKRQATDLEGNGVTSNKPKDGSTSKKRKPQSTDLEGCSLSLIHI